MAITNVKNFKARIQNKHDIEVNWNKATTFVPLAGELIIYDRESADGTTLLPGVSLPTGRTVPYTYNRVKVGDGVTPVTQLSFIDKEVKDTMQATVDSLISCGTTDPSSTTTGKFYFKYS